MGEYVSRSPTANENGLCSAGRLRIAPVRQARPAQSASPSPLTQLAGLAKVTPVDELTHTVKLGALKMLTGIKDMDKQKIEHSGSFNLTITAAEMEW